LNLTWLKTLRGFKQRGIDLMNLLYNGFCFKWRTVQTRNHFVHKLRIKALSLKSIPVRKVSIVDHEPSFRDSAIRLIQAHAGDFVFLNLPVALRAPSRLRNTKSVYSDSFCLNTPYCTIIGAKEIILSPLQGSPTLSKIQGLAKSARPWLLSGAASRLWEVTGELLRRGVVH